VHVYYSLPGAPIGARRELGIFIAPAARRKRSGEIAKLGCSGRGAVKKDGRFSPQRWRAR
jgi:hypothetical protein